MRILEILNSPPGETFILEHIRAIENINPEVEIVKGFTQSLGLGVIKHRGQKHGIAIPNFDRLTTVQKVKLALQGFSFDRHKLRKQTALKTIQKSQCDIIHFHFASAAQKWYWLAKDLNIPFTFSLRGTDVQIFPYTKKGYIEELQNLANLAYSIHAVCEDIKQEFIDLTGCQSNKIKVIRTVINKKWSTVDRKPINGNLLAIGRLHWRKNFSDLVLACSILNKRGLQFKLEIVGEGEERQKLEFMISDLNLNEKVSLRGLKSSDEIRKLFTDAEFIVLPSLQEGFPNVLGEAMLASLPIISTNCNGIEEVLEDGRNAFIMETASPEKLADKIEEAFKRRDRIQEYNQINLALGNDIFSEESHSKNFLEFWSER